MPKRTLTGKVITERPDSTRIVQFSTKQSHGKFGKSVLVSKKYQAHDPKLVSKLGDTVLIVESKPISKTKRWMVQDVIASEG